MELWTLRRTTILGDQKLICTPKSWCSHSPAQYAAKGICEDCVTRVSGSSDIQEQYMPGKRGALRPRESAYDIDAFLLYFEKKGLKNEGLLLFAKLSKIVGNWCFPEKITMEKDQVPPWLQSWTGITELGENWNWVAAGVQKVIVCYLQQWF